MKQKFLFSAMLVCLLAFGLTGCDNPSSPGGGDSIPTELVASWGNDGEQLFEIKADGTGTFDGKDCTWSATPDELTIHQDGVTGAVKYVINGDGKLVISGPTGGELAELWEAYMRFSPFDNLSPPDPSAPSWKKADVSGFDNLEHIAVAYGGGKFVAVGTNGHVAHSEDGITWRNTGNTGMSTSATLTDIAYGGAPGSEKFVAVGFNTLVAHSTDGITWTVSGVDCITFPDGGPFDEFHIKDLAYGGGRFVAVGDCGYVVHSEDGINWAAKIIEFGEHDENTGYCTNISAIAYGDGKFVAVGELGLAAYSTDGIEWEDAVDITSFDDTLIYYNRIAYGGGKFVAGGTNCKAAYSEDGKKWTDIADTTFDGRNNSITNIAYGGGKFVAVDFYWQAAYSTDGKTWKSTGDIEIDSDCTDIAYGGGKFVAVGTNGTVAYFNDQE
jgi:hypothetical protein